MLVICPTRGRIDWFKRMVDSLFKTAKGCIYLVAVLDWDDPQVAKYETFCQKNDIGSEIYHVGISTTKKINAVFDRNIGFDFYSVTNDDFVYRTDGWNLALKEAAGLWGIAYPNDLSKYSPLPTTSVISGNIVRALGWLQLPTLTHLCGDLVWQTIGNALGSLTYCPDVIVEHLHHLQGKAPAEQYERTNSKEMYEKDNKAFREWRRDHLQNDIRKIQEARRRAGG